MHPEQNNCPPQKPMVTGKKPGCLGQFLLLLVILAVVGLGIPALLTPWGFYMGGTFHLIPVWHGWGRMHSNTAGGDYVIQVSFNPKVGRYMGPRHVNGNAWLCTPQGEKLRLRLGGDFQKDLQLDTNGKTASFYMNNYSLKSQFNGSDQPHLELRGKWMNPNLVLDDHGSIARNFGPDGRLRTSLTGVPYMQEVVPVTLHQGSNADFEAACRAVNER